MRVVYPDYDEFYGHYEPFVRSFIARRTTSDVVDDLVSDVFAIAWRRRDDVPKDALPWLYRTARNVVGNRYRSGSRLAALESKMRAVPIESPADPAQLAADRDRTVTAFAALSESDRELLLLVAWEGLSINDVAEALELSPGAATVRVHRARQRLNEALAADDAGPSSELTKDCEIRRDV